MAKGTNVGTMRIGLDFDNTIVSYDHVFHMVAVDHGLIDPAVPASKVAIRDHMRRTGNEDAWTELQGYVYGKRMADASAFPGVVEFLRHARDSAITVYIISHKTRYPFAGPRYDLHQAAEAWIESTLVDEGGALICRDNISFYEGKDEKISRVGALECDVFVDDLPEILTAPGFPDGTRRILFDPDRYHAPLPGIQSIVHWKDIRSHITVMERRGLGG